MQEELIDGVITFEADTDGVIVRVQSYFIEDQSDPDENQFVWAYRVQIENQSEHTVQLMTRHWEITNALGVMTVVDGDGVIGEQPILAPGESHIYTSGTPLETPTGFMGGHYGMRASNGRVFDAKVPHFSLDSPYQEQRVN